MMIQKLKWGLILIALFAMGACKEIKTDLTLNIELKDNWLVQKSDKVKLSGTEISSEFADTSNWLKASVPSTIMGVLTANNFYPDLFMGENLKKVDIEQFNQSWWYRKSININKIREGQHVFLHFDGISYYANIWLNGRIIASRDTIFGAFRTFEFDVTKQVKAGKNVLAVEVFRQEPGDFGIGFVDWNPKPPDGSMGIWRGVNLKITGEAAIGHVFVHTKVNLKTLDEAWITIDAELANPSIKPVKGILKGKIENIEFNYPVNLRPGEKKMIALTSKEIPGFHIQHPRLWWCNNLGKPNLYKLTLQLVSRKCIADKADITFGIRQIEDYYNTKGYRGFKLNGREILIKGAGWTDDLFLRDNAKTDEIQVQYVKHMNLNAIRLENFWGNSQDLFNLCDKYGILVMAGWSCQWEWEGYLGKPCDEYGGIKTNDDIGLMVKSFGDQVQWLQNHPCIFVWTVGSDKLPRPALESEYKKLVNRMDDRPYLAAANGLNSTISGPTGVKMNGPYEYEGPNYWYIDSLNGGAFGFNTETSPGPQIPVLESLQKMIPQNKLWPVNSVWSYHCTSAEEAFNSLDVFNTALNCRYGKANNLKDYLLESDVMSYEAMKAMYEAFRVNRPNATGIIQWMLNSAWPSVYWQLYDYYFLPTSAYYATRVANKPLQLIYNYGNNRIYAVNETRQDRKNLKAVIRLYNTKSEEILSREIPFDIPPDISKNLFDLPVIKGIEFLSLTIQNEKNQPVADNFYWLSEKADAYAWDKTFWAYTPMKSYADFKDLHNMPSSNLDCQYSFSLKNDSGLVKVDLKNTTGKIAFFIRLTLQDEHDITLFPAFWDDNLFSILPGEYKSVYCILPGELLKNKMLKLAISGWNVKNQTILIHQ